MDVGAEVGGLIAFLPRAAFQRAYRAITISLCEREDFGTIVHGVLGDHLGRPVDQRRL